MESEATGGGGESNPFSTRFIRPGALAYRFPAGISPEELVGRLRAADWRGEIVGPHGTGKSTLLESLLAPLAGAGREVALRRLSAGATSPGFTRSEMAGWSEATQVIVDGCEQLSYWARVGLGWACRRRGAGLLVTSHRSLGFPLLWETTVSAELATELVGALLGKGKEAPSEATIAELLRGHRGNFRETLFSLYDWYEQRRW